MAGRRLTRFTVDPVDTNGMLAERVASTDRCAAFSTQRGDQS